MTTPYATESEATTYFSEILNSDAWDDASSANRDIALKQATNIIDRLNFRGQKADETQENEFPRGDDTVVPDDVKNATAEVAMALLDDVDPDIEFDNLRIQSERYANVQSTYREGTEPDHLIAGVPSVTAWRFLKKYIRDSRSIRLDRIS